jgi:hypothetical protein
MGMRGADSPGSLWPAVGKGNILKIENRAGWKLFQINQKGVDNE